jgi:hypothetical protein
MEKLSEVRANVSNYKNCSDSTLSIILSLDAFSGRRTPPFFHCCQVPKSRQICLTAVRFAELAKLSRNLSGLNSGGS